MITNIGDQLARDEGKRASAYMDSLGYITIGIGTCIDARKGCGLTDDEINLLLANRLAIAKEELQKLFPWTEGLDDARFGVLWNMSYQLGVRGLSEFTRFLAAVQSGAYVMAAEEMLDSKWARVDSPGRAQRLSQQMKTGVWV